MSLQHRLLVGSALTLVALTPAFAQTPTVGGLVQLWYTQMTDNSLRLNSSAAYYNLRSEFKENTFAIRRTEIKLSGKITDEVGYEVMIDPSAATSTFDGTKPNGSYNPMILQDAALLWKIADGLDLKAGQFKTLQTYEGNTSSSELLFAERSQLGRVFGDKRDRGAILSLGLGDPKEFAWKASVAMFNGMSDLASGKANDTNSQKDMVARLDFNLGSTHKFGIYTLQGSTDQSDKGALTAYTFAGRAANPLNPEILENKDKTTNLGAYYAFQTSSWHLSAEYMTGLLGRRNGSVYDAKTTPASTNALRQHLDQKFVGYYLTGAYTVSSHSFLLRYDFLNYNSGSNWYTSYNPYTQNAQGAPLGADYTPKFTEITVGYTYAWKPEKVKAANFKLNYIARSKNFLKPNAINTVNAPQSGEQGGNTIVAALQVAF